MGFRLRAGFSRLISLAIEDLLLRIEGLGFFGLRVWGLGWIANTTESEDLSVNGLTI